MAGYLLYPTTPLEAEPKQNISTCHTSPSLTHLSIPNPPLCTAPANSYGRVSAPSHNTSGSRNKAEHLYPPHLSISNPPLCTAPTNSYDRVPAPSHNTSGSRTIAEHTSPSPTHLPDHTSSLPHQEETCCRTSTPRCSSLHLQSITFDSNVSHAHTNIHFIVISSSLTATHAHTIIHLLITSPPLPDSY